jgi:hypothetical protein
VGANTAVFSLTDAILTKPLPYPEPDRLASVVPALKILRLDPARALRDSRILGSFDVSALSSRTADGASPRFAAGHVLVKSDGSMHLWEPHGLISECMRSSNDQRQPWLDPLDADARAHQLWCEQRGYAAVQSNAWLKEFVDEIDGLLADPCK